MGEGTMHFECQGQFNVAFTDNPLGFPHILLELEAVNNY